MMTQSSTPQPTKVQIRRWRKYMADEVAEGAIYRELAVKRTGQEHQILRGLAEAEERHENYWRAKLGEHARPVRPSLRRTMLRFMARHFGSVFVLALAQRAEGNSPYATDQDAAPQMAADEQVHEEVVRALATAGRTRLIRQLPRSSFRSQRWSRFKFGVGYGYWRYRGGVFVCALLRYCRFAGRCAVHGSRRVRLGAFPARAALRITSHSGHTLCGSESRFGRERIGLDL